MSSLVEVDSVEILVINDNEVDPMSYYTHPDLQVSGQMRDLATFSPNHVHDRGDAKNELRMESLCCGSHGLSLMIVRALATIVLYSKIGNAFPRRP
jgi:7,8-dihydropterin-6-yl-methyl-4-(beta-D-ribofuranosyl)aminobenzene 5'-phosphate synthase